MTSAADAANDYERHVEAMRQSRLTRLRHPEGWLSLVGLEWLHDGVNTVGADADSDVVLRGSDAPPRAGTLVVDGNGVRFVAAPRADVTHDGRIVDEIELRDDEGGMPTTLAIGSLRFHLIRRGPRLALRVRDRAAATRTAFEGLDYFPIDPSWRVVARFEPSVGVTLAVPDVIGLVTDEPSPGAIVFVRGGSEYRLDAMPGEDGALWLVFGDATNGGETYGGGRFLLTRPPDAGAVVVDFNLAFNPPCVFTPYATCPLPPPGNRLPIRIEAGERAYEGNTLPT